MTDHQIIALLAAQADPKALGAKNLADLLATRLRISVGDANQRIKDAKLLGPRQSMTAEPLAPALPNFAAAQARGQIGAEHVRIIEKFFKDLPGYIDATTRAQAEADLARNALGFGPTDFRKAADRLALLLNQDGDPPDHAEQARRRYLKIDKPGRDGLSRIHGWLDPEARATLECGFAKSAPPACATPTTTRPASTANPTTPPSAAIPAARANATTTHSRPSPVRCWRPASWANSTGYPPPSS